MPSTKDIDTTARFFSIFKGAPGTGKTRAAGSFPAPYFFDFDGRLSIIRTIFPDKDVQYDSYYKNFKAAMDKFAIAAIQGTTLIEPMTNQEVNTVVENAYRIAKRMEEYRIDLTSKTVINTPINNTTQHNNNTKGVK